MKKLFLALFLTSLLWSCGSEETTKKAISNDPNAPDNTKASEIVTADTISDAPQDSLPTKNEGVRKTEETETEIP